MTDDELLVRNPDARKLEPSPPGFRISFKGRMVAASIGRARLRIGVPRCSMTALSLPSLPSRGQLLREECRTFFLRIRAVLDAKGSRGLGTGPCCLSDHRLLFACNRDMTELEKIYPWHGFLDAQLALRAWILGAESALRIRNEKCDEGRSES